MDSDTHTQTHRYILTLGIPIYRYLVVIQNGAQVVSGFPRKSNIGTNPIFVSIFSHNSIIPCSPFSTPGMRSAGPRFLATVLTADRKIPMREFTIASFYHLLHPVLYWRFLIWFFYLFFFSILTITFFYLVFFFWSNLLFWSFILFSSSSKRNFFIILRLFPSSFIY